MLISKIKQIHVGKDNSVSGVHGSFNLDSCTVHSTEQICGLDSYLYKFMSITLGFELALAIHSHYKSEVLCYFTDFIFSPVFPTVSSNGE